MDIKFNKKASKATLLLSSEEKENFKNSLKSYYNVWRGLEKSARELNVRLYYLQEMNIILEMLKNKAIDTEFLDNSNVNLSMVQVCFLAHYSQFFITNDVLTKIDKFFLSVRK